VEDPSPSQLSTCWLTSNTAQEFGGDRDKNRASVDRQLALTKVDVRRGGIIAKLRVQMPTAFPELSEISHGLIVALTPACTALFVDTTGAELGAAPRFPV
jgi:hypothetical protein